MEQLRQLNEGSPFPARQTYESGKTHKRFAHLRMNDSFIDLDEDLIRDVEKELLTKASLVEAGVDNPTAVEKFALQILLNTY